MQQLTKKIGASFSSGFAWFYWDWYKDKQDMGESEAGNTIFAALLPGGYQPRQLYVKQKYSNYKQEILHHVARSKYIKCLDKAKKYMPSTKVRHLSASAWDIIHHFGIKDGSPITLNHIVSIILYCDLDRYSTRFSESFRKTYSYETMYFVRNRNSEYWWQAKLLKEAVLYFGTCNYSYDGNLTNNQLETGPFCM